MSEDNIKIEDLDENKIKKQKEHKSAKTSIFHTRWTGLLLVASGCLLILSAPALIWLFRDRLAEVGPSVFKTLWYGAGGLALLDFTAGLPLGAILVAMGGVHLTGASRGTRRILLPLLGIYLIYFVYHSLSAFRYTSVPFPLFAIFGCLLIALFLSLVWVWVRRRSGLQSEHQRAADLQMGGALCFFTAAWQACGMAGAPGFAIYPELAGKLGNQSFLVGQVLAIQVFTCLGFVLLLIGMRGKTR